MKTKSVVPPVKKLIKKELKKLLLCIPVILKECPATMNMIAIALKWLNEFRYAMGKSLTGNGQP